MKKPPLLWLFIKQDDAESQLRAYQAKQQMIEDYRTAHLNFKDEVYIAGIPILILPGNPKGQPQRKGKQATWTLSILVEIPLLGE